jgi:hypothetical protein
MSVVASMFPPERTTATEPVPCTRPARSAARPTAPAPSTRNFVRSTQRTSACAISSSDTETRSSSVSFEHAARELSLVLHGDAVRDRVPGLALHADDCDVRAPLLEREEIPRSEPAATDGDDEGLRLRRLLRELEADRALPRDDALVLERVHERRSGRLDVGGRGGDRLVEAPRRRAPVSPP